MEREAAGDRRGRDELDRQEIQEKLQRSSFRVDKVRFAQCVFPMGQSSDRDLRELRLLLVIRNLQIFTRLYCERKLDM